MCDNGVSFGLFPFMNMETQLRNHFIIHQFASLPDDHVTAPVFVSSWA